VKLLYGNDDSVRPSVCPSVRPSVRPRFFVGALTFERVKILHFCFRKSTVWVRLQVKFVTELNQMTPSWSTVKGHVNFKYIAPSCEVSLERSFKGLTNDTQHMGPVTVI
jgi:hypothetical protein